MITFVSETTSRTFTVYDNNFHFIQKLLTRDIKVGNLQVISKNWLSVQLATKIALDINRLVKTNIIYEFQTCGVIEPLINPTSEQVEKLKQHIRPLSEKRKIFLNKFVDYLLDNGSFNIS